MILKSPKTSSNMQSEQPNITNMPLTENLRADIIGGRSLNEMRACFDQDDRNIIVTTSSGILYFNIESCKQIGQANLGSERLSPAEAIVSSDLFDNLLYLFTNHGQIFVWNLEVRDWSNQLALPITVGEENLVSCKILSKRQYVYTTRNLGDGSIYIRHSMSRSERERPKNRDFIGKCQSGGQNSFDIGCLYPISDSRSPTKSERDKMSKQRYLAFIRSGELCFQKLGVGEKFSGPNVLKQLIHGEEFTCVRANSQMPMVAAGDTLGRIYIYTGNFSTNELNRTKLHWHTLPVNDLCFSSTGNTLYSVGGESGCVAIWDLSPNNIGQKHIIPRLGMPIRLINCSKNLNQLVLSFEDNELQFMDTDGKTRELRTLTKRTIDMYLSNDSRALRQVSSAKQKQNSLGLLWHSKTDTIVTNAKTGWLQFYSPKAKSRTLSLNFLKNRVLSLEREDKVVPSEITRAAFTSDGNWLALFETQESEGIFPEVKLHIWQRSSTTNRWGWIQTADRLHNTTNIVDLKFSPDGQYLISLSEDGSFNVLHRICLDVKSGESSLNRQMYANGFVGNVPEKLASVATFSHDSSVMAIGLKNDTTLIWMIVDPFKFVYECQLSQVEVDESDQTPGQISPTPQNEVLGLHFGHHRPTQSVAPLCEVRSRMIRIWNILNPHETMEFAVTNISHEELDEFTAAAFDHCSRDKDQFAVCTKSNQILIFNIHIDPDNGKLEPLIVFKADAPTSSLLPVPHYTSMCFVSEPVLDIDNQCLQDAQLLRVVNRLCLLNNHQELVAITDKLTLERQSSINNCNAIKTVDMTELQAYFVKSATIHNEHTQSQSSSQKANNSSITEKQRKIRNRLEVQRMLKDLLTKIPSQNLPKMEILGPMILDKLI